ncbi:2-phosphosulfolactate phosphatase [Rhodohalobacter sulfatireducens]|uniref:Probable 2-phosphosulfolactate phosphatase n=1 Tax=Rhodohalobacter sulfatireducens TaxID=2911366 RepID=A0ABS9KCL8_9BACT|nr:2-phosphosulfolactate phosphatase [Rhodohalobacter sulfatireducens]MCG2588602.1 2-phosphosulfolactate phosphatase [Rhodohalobacter sulfatireducens]MDR9363855.1 2-phosphosulfolactate phosphatase [Balneolaceae bacterium]MDR9407250.1 2-phosphosulfolactate phosphatase [Balneolaceae bacterium]
MVNIETIDVFYSLHSFQEDELRDKTVVIIDVLRASSTIVTAFMNGAKAIIPVGDMGEASKIAQNVDSDNYLLCGEKDGEKIEGYDLGNSPLEYLKEIVEGKNLIFNTTNGTKAIKKSLGSSKTYIASFLNVSAIVDELKKQENEIVLVCAGWKGRLAFEDMLLAGNIIHLLCNGSLPNGSRDGAKVAFGLYDKFGDDISTVIHQSNHATRLKDIIGTSDIDYCCQVDITDMLPRLKEGMITLTDG